MTCITAESGAHKQLNTDLACPSVVLGFDAAVAQCEPTLRVQGIDGKRSLPVLCRLQQAQAQSSAGTGLLKRVAPLLTRDSNRHRHNFRVQRVDGKRSIPKLSRQHQAQAHGSGCRSIAHHPCPSRPQPGPALHLTSAYFCWRWAERARDRCALTLRCPDRSQAVWR